MAKPRGKTANLFVWIILGLLIIGLAGFGVDGFGGSVRSIGQVGDREISAQDYASALQQRQQQMAQQGEPVSLSEMRERGIDRDVLRDLVTRAAIENEAEQMGLSVGDDVIAREITAISGFQGVGGDFDREAYRRALDRQGMRESEFEDRLRRDIARDILQAAVLGGASQPGIFMQTLMRHIGERRSFSIARLDPEQLDQPVPAPTDSQLEAHYEDNIEAYTRPEARRLTYAWITPEMMLDEIEIDEEALHDLYEQRAAEYRQPERRLVERLVMPDMESAEEAMARIEDGSADFADIVAERGLDLADTDMGDVTREALGAAGAPVFARDAPGVVGPVETNLGPALFRMNAVLAAQETPFEEVRDELRDTHARDRARRLIAQRRDDYADLLAAGARLEELADETGMELGEIDYTGESDARIAGYEAFRDVAGSVEEGDFPELHALDDGGLFALRLDGTVAPEPAPLDDVIVEVIDDWERAQALSRLAEQAEGQATELRGGADFADLDLVPEQFEALTRDAFIDNAPAGLMQTVFEMEPGGVEAVRGDAGVHIVRLDDVAPPATDDPDLAQLRDQLEQSMAQGLSGDIFRFYTEALQTEAGITLDDSAINAVHAQMR